MMSEKEARTITFWRCCRECRSGMEHIGSPASKGLSLEELTTPKTLFEEQGYQCELIDLREKYGIYLRFCSNFNAELNVYYDLDKCGIGFHGDA